MVARGEPTPLRPPDEGGDLRSFLVDAVRPALYMVIRFIEKRYGIEPVCAECRRRRGGRN